MSAFPEKFAVLRTQSSRGPYYQFLQSESHLSGYRMFNPDWCTNFNMVGHYMFNESITNRRKSVQVWTDQSTRLLTVYYVILPYELHIAGNSYPVLLFHYNAWLPRPEHRILLSRDAVRHRVTNLVRTYSWVLNQVVNPEDNDSDDDRDNSTFANMLPAPSTPPRRSSSSSDASHPSLITLAPTAESQSIEPLDRLASLAVQRLETERVVTEAVPIPEFVGRLLITNARQGSESCPISTIPYREIESLSATSCFHVFETESLQRWLRENRTCPVCRIHVRNMVTQEN